MSDQPWTVGDSPCWPARWRMLWNGQAISNATSEFYRERAEAVSEAERRNAGLAHSAGEPFATQEGEG